MSHVFISYSSIDQEYADALAERLTDEGFNVWIDHELVPGDQWWQTIVKSIKTCGAFIVVMSPNSDGSPWVGREILIADQLKKPVMPILIEGSEDLLESKNWSIYVTTQYANHLDRSLPEEEYFRRLAQYIPRNKGSKGKLIGKLGRSTTEFQQIENVDISGLPEKLKQAPTSNDTIPKIEKQRATLNPLTIGIVSIILLAVILGGLYINSFFAVDEDPLDSETQVAESSEDAVLARTPTATPEPRVDINSYEHDEQQTQITVGLILTNRDLIDRYDVRLISRFNGREYFNQIYHVLEDIQSPTLFIPLDDVPPEFYLVEIRAYNRANDVISQSILEISLIPPTPTPLPTAIPTPTPTLPPDITPEPLEVSVLNTCIEVIGLPYFPTITEVNIRQSATSDSELLGKATVGQQGLVEAVEVEVRDDGEEYTWYLANWGTITGWLRNDLLGDCSDIANYGVDTTGECVATVFGITGMNMRTGSGTSFDVVSRLAYLQQAPVIDIAEDVAESPFQWLRLDTGEDTGWLREDFVGVEGNCIDLGIATNLYPAPLPAESYTWARGYDPEGLLSSVHYGIDLAVEAGTPVRAGGAGGIVVQVAYCEKCGEEGASTLERGLSLSDARVFSDPGWNYGYGHYIIVGYEWEHLPLYTQNQLRDMGYEDASAMCLYSHLQTLLTEEGATLQAHQQFATSGNSGSSSGPHLAIECRANFDLNSSFATNRAGQFDPRWLFSLAPLAEPNLAPPLDSTPEIVTSECPLTEERIFAASMAITSVFQGGYASYQTYDSGIASYGLLQYTLAGGSLITVIQNYIANSDSETAQTLENDYLARVEARDANLRNDSTFRDLLITAASEDAMQQAQLQVAYDGYWQAVVDGYITHRQIELPLSYALLFDTGVVFGVNHGFVRLAEQDLGVASRSIVGENGITEEELLTYVADLRKQSHDRQAERENLPGLAVQGDFWFDLVTSGDWLLEGDDEGFVYPNDTPVQVCNPDILLPL